MPRNLQEFHESLNLELQALKNRVRNLTDHDPTDGEFKETILRVALRRHLPDDVAVGRGFIVGKEETSSQVDVLIVDCSKPTLFRDGDLYFVTPDAVLAAMEAKTSLKDGPAIVEACSKIGKVGQIAAESGRTPWLGVFDYEGKVKDNSWNNIVSRVKEGAEESGVPINSLVYGSNRFVRFWDGTTTEEDREPPYFCGWRIYHLKNLAVSYFIGNAIDAVSNFGADTNSFAWYPLVEGKGSKKKREVVWEFRQ